MSISGSILAALLAYVWEFATAVLPLFLTLIVVAFVMRWSRRVLGF